MTAKIMVQCKCGQKLSVSTDIDGARFRCPKCQHKMRLALGDPEKARREQEERKAAEQAENEALRSAEEETDAIPASGAAQSDSNSAPEETPAIERVSPRAERASSGQEAGGGAQMAELTCDQCQSVMEIEMGTASKVVKCTNCLHTIPVPRELRIEPVDASRTARLLAGKGAIKKSMTSAILCVCEECGLRYVLGANAAAVPGEKTVKKLAEKKGVLIVGQPSKGVPDKVSMMEGHESWPEDEDLPEPRDHVSSRITRARDRHESRHWRCEACQRVHKYDWHEDPAVELRRP